MRRKKRSSFPAVLFLCLVLLIAVGVRQRAAQNGSPFSLHSVIDRLLFADGSSAPASSLPEETASSATESEAEHTVSASKTPSSSDGCYTYYFQQLNTAEQDVYQKIYNCVSSREHSVTLDTTDTDAIHRIYRFVLCDHPELFWCIGSSQSTVYTSQVDFMPDYSCSAEEIKTRTDQIEQSVSECLSGLSADASDYEKVRHVYTWIVNTVDYDLNASDNQNIYSSLAGHASVCAGYAKGVQYLLDRLSVPCIYITGTLSEGGTHAWNMVQCNGSWYQVDATFGDPVFLTSQDVPENNLSYAYLCCTDAQIKGSHIPDQDVSFPACTSIDLNYYIQNGWFIRSCDEAALTELITATITEGQDGFTLQCADSSTYRQVCDALLDTVIPAASQTYMEKHNLKQIQYSYSKDAAMLVFTLHWEAE